MIDLHLVSALGHLDVREIREKHLLDYVWKKLSEARPPREGGKPLPPLEKLSNASAAELRKKLLKDPLKQRLQGEALGVLEVAKGRGTSAACSRRSTACRRGSLSSRRWPRRVTRIGSL